MLDSANQRSPDAWRAITPARRITRRRGHDHLHDPLLVAAGTATETSADAGTTGEVEHTQGIPMEVPLAVIPAPPFASRATARRCSRRPDAGEAYGPVASDPDRRSSLALLVFAATTSAAATVARGYNLRAWVAPPGSPSVPRSHPLRPRSPTALRRHEPMPKPGPDVRATTARRVAGATPLIDRGGASDQPRTSRERARRQWLVLRRSATHALGPADGPRERRRGNDRVTTAVRAY